MSKSEKPTNGGDYWPDEAVDGYLAGNFGVGSQCESGHTLYLVNCTACQILQMQLSGEIDAAL